MAYKRRSGSYLPAAIVVAALRLSVEPQAVYADFTTCASNQLSWYTGIVGESPCTTYQRLRRICNKDYQVDIFSSTAPGDRCEDKVSTLCCCNMIAFQLSMLCMVCQLDTKNAGVGFDAHKGTYGVYRNGCTTSPVTNHTLPDNIQSIVCKEDIPLPSFLYNGWDDGTWFYFYTKTLAEKDHAAKTNDTSSHCQNRIALSSTPVATGARTLGISSITTPSQSSDPNTGERSKSQSNLTLIVGIVGSLISLAIVVLAVVIWRRRNTKSQGGEAGSDMYGYSTIAPASTSARANAFTPNRLITGGLASQVLHGSGPMLGTTGSDSGSLPPPYDHLPVPGNIRPNAGRPPPAYNDSWDSDRNRSTHPSAGAAALPSSGLANFKKLRGGRR